MFAAVWWPHVRWWGSKSSELGNRLLTPYTWSQNVSQSYWKTTVGLLLPLGRNPHPKSKSKVRFCFKQWLMCSKRKDFGLFPSKTPLPKSLSLPLGRTSAVEQTHLSKQHLGELTSMSRIVWMETSQYVRFLTFHRRTFIFYNLMLSSNHFSHPSTQ